jgi:hypothetical protein
VKRQLKEERVVGRWWRARRRTRRHRFGQLLAHSGGGTKLFFEIFFFA